MGQVSYFNLQKGEKINYKLIAENTDIHETKKIKLILSDASKFTSTVKECSISSGCQFTLQAVE